MSRLFCVRPHAATFGTACAVCCCAHAHAFALERLADKANPEDTGLGRWTTAADGPQCNRLQTHMVFLCNPLVPSQVVDCKQTDGGKDSRWRGTFRWSDDLNQANTDFFANSAFRPNQREAINATMSGKDCFVLMPTGGGDLLPCKIKKCRHIRKAEQDCEDH